MGPYLEVEDRLGSGAVVVSGTLRPVLGAALASVILAPARDRVGGVVWCVIEVGRTDSAVRVTPLASLDPTRRVASVEATAYTVAADRVLTSLATERVDEVVLAL